MVTKENALQFAEVCKWIADGECQFLDGSHWRGIESLDKLDFTKSIHHYRRRPRKVTRTMTALEVIALGPITRRERDSSGDLQYRLGTDWFSDSAVQTWVNSRMEYSTDGGKSWHPFTVTEEVAK